MTEGSFLLELEIRGGGVAVVEGCSDPAKLGLALGLAMTWFCAGHLAGIDHGHPVPSARLNLLSPLDPHSHGQASLGSSTHVRPCFHNITTPTGLPRPAHRHNTRPRRYDSGPHDPVSGLSPIRRGLHLHRLYVNASGLMTKFPYSIRPHSTRPHIRDVPPATGPPPR